MDRCTGPSAGQVGRRVQAELDQLLARTIDEVAPARTATRAAPVDLHLTGRELTLPELLPTQLSSAEMGERLLLSVNTVKTNLTTLYRKPGASTRIQVVEAGQRAGLI